MKKFNNIGRNKMIKKVSKLLILSASLFASVAVLSCEVGLGSAIDTESPSASITYPPESAIIRDYFYLAGTCSDDDKVERVEVSLVCDGSTVLTENASIEDNKAWSLKVNQKGSGGYNGYPLPDGSYTANVTVFDGSGKSTGPYARSFTIDNTAPIFIISSPNSLTSDKEYGTSLNVSGTVADSSGLSEMKIAVYEDISNTLNQKGVFSVKDIDTSDGTSVDFARFNKNAVNSPLSENYTTIYGTVTLTNGTTGDIADSNPKRNFKTNVVLYDKAKTYQSPATLAATSSVGNSTYTVYSYSDVYTKLLGGAPLSLTPGELIKNMNGKMSTSENFGDGTQTVKEFLESKAIDTGFVDENNNPKKLLKFTLDPTARPNFTVTTLTNNNVSTFNADVLSLNMTEDAKKNAITSRVSNGQVLTASVNGFGTTEIQGETLKMWMHRLDSGEFTKENIQAAVTKLEKAVYDDNIQPNAGGVLDANGSEWIKISDDNETYENSSTITMNSKPLPSLLSQEFYVVAITGRDVEGAAIDQSKIFGFMGQPSSAMPVIKITSIEDNKYYTGSDYSSMKISGTATAGGDTGKLKQVEVWAAYGSTETTHTVLNSNINDHDYTINKALSQVVSSLNIPSTENNFNVIIYVKATDEDNNSTTKRLKINVDRLAPVINIASAGPVVTEYNGTAGKFINGNFTTEINITEVKLSEVSYTITNGTTTGAPVILGNASTYKIEIPTTNYTNGSTLKLTFTAKDEAGNSYSLDSTEYTIQQETDKPKISIINADASKKNETDDLSADNLFDTTTKKALNIAVEDDDLLEDVKVSIYYAENEIGTPTKHELTPVNSFTALSTTYYAASYELNIGYEGVYKIEVEVKDETYDAANAANRSASTDFYIAVDKAVPVITESTGSTTKITNLASNLTYSGTISDTNGIYNGGTGAITATATKAGESTPAKTWTIDATRSETTLRNGSWSLSIASTDFTGFDTNAADGLYSIAITVKDAAGRTKTINRSMKIDTVKPVISTSEISNTAHTASDSTSGWYNSANLDISATATDAGGSLSKLEFVKVPAVWAATAEPTAEQVNGQTWTKMNALSTADTYGYTVSEMASGATAIALKATDTAGNVSYSKINAVNIDTSAPQLDDSVSATGTEGDSNVYVKIGETESKSSSALSSVRSDQSTDAIVKVALKDEGGSGIDSGKIYISVHDRFGSAEPDASKKVNVTLADDSAAACGLSSGIYKFTIPHANIDNGSVYMRYYDMAGNYTDTIIFSFYVDNTPPLASITSPISTDVNGKLKITGTAEDETALREVKLYYTTTAPTSTTNAATAFTSTNLIGTISCAGLTSKEWSFGDTTGIDFEAIANVTSRAAPKTIYLVPVVYDEAGHVNNFWEQYRTYNVDLNSDRPVIKFAELRNAGQIFTYTSTGAISGTISDDDDNGTKVVKKLIISSSPITIGADGEPENAETETTIDYASGEWTFTPADNSDGQKNVYIYVEDNAGGKFYTGATYVKDTCGGDPYVQLNGSAKADNTTGLSYKIDNQGPSVSNIVLEWRAASTGDADNSSDEVSKATVVGGTKRYYRLKITGHDTSGVSSMTLSLANQGSSSNYEEFDSATNGTFAAVVNSGVTSQEDFIWTTPWLDSQKSYTVSGSAHTIEDEILSGMIGITDASGIDGASSVTFTIDNKAPVASLISPNANVVQTGAVNISATASDNGDAGLASVKWMVPLKTQSTMTDAQLAAVAAATEAEITAGTDSGKWRPFTLDGATYKSSFTEAMAFNATSNTGKYTDTNTFATTIFDNTQAAIGDKTYDIPVYVLATDNAGNYFVRKASVRYCPNASIPKSYFTYPTSDDYDKTADGSSRQNYITLGGTIRLNGVSEDDMGIAANFIQIDTDLADTFASPNYDSADKSYLEGKGYEIVTDLSEYGVTAPAGWWGIKCAGTSSWNCVLNDSEQLVSDDADTARNICIRVCSIDIDDGTQHLSSWSAPINIKVDDKAPKIGNKLSKMYQFGADVASVAVNVTGSGSTETVTATASSSTAALTPEKITDYYSNMFLRGKWYYAVSVEDENAIEEVKVYKNNSLLTAGTDYVYVNYNAESAWRKQIIYIPIDQTNTEVAYRIVAKDQDTTVHTTEQTFNFKIDNEAPVLESLTSEGNALAASGVTFQDSNYTFDISGNLSDSTNGSGIDYLLFYFTRTYGTGSSSVTKIFDAAKQGQTAGDGVDITDLEELSITQGSGSSAKTYKLYGKKFTGGTYSASGSTFTYTATGISSDEHIRAGGLIYIDGMYHIITDVSGNTVTFENAASGATTAVFPYAHVVNKGEKSRTATVDPLTKRYAASVDIDDDGIIETFNGNSFAKTFKAEFYSRDIPDGPATLNCILFDKAGNVTGTSVSGTISNHAPRLAKLYLGTDLNGDNSYDDTEFNSYMAGSVNSLDNTQVTEYKQEFELETAAEAYGYGRSFKATKDLIVVPEYTGGSGTLRMRYLSDASTETEKQTATTAQLIAPYSGTAVTANFTPLKNGISGDSKYLDNNTQTIFCLSGTDVIGADGTDKAVSFTFWDETDGLTQGTDSEYFFVRITDLHVDLTDNEAPHVYINPFHWNSLNDNSIYGTEKLTDIKQLKGHIELESDWAKASGYSSAATTGEFDGDPKVSGIIVVRGTAYDDQRMSAIQVSLPGFAFTGARGGSTAAGGEALAAIYSSATKKWTNASATLAANGWSFKVYDINDSAAATKNTASKKGAFFGQRGHQVYWELCLDTSFVTNKVALDEQLVIQAVDFNNNETVNTATKTGTGTVAETANKSNYRMDIVPYITGIATKMSGYDDNNPSIYGRTSTGSYPVYAVTASGTSANNLAAYDYETVTLQGFNIASGGVITFTGTNATATANAALKVSIPAAATSGAAEYSYTTGTGANAVTIIALNNHNYNNSFGECKETAVKNAGFETSKTAADNNTAADTLDYAGGKYNVYKHFYNRQPNDENNNVLTDDLAFDVWDINNRAAVAIQKGKADNPVMKINPNNGLIGFAFSNGGTWFSMPDTNNSYQYWNMSYDYMQYNELAYDPNGRSYATSVGGDISGGTNDKFSFMTSRWGTVTNSTTDQGANYGGEKHIRIDPIGNDTSNRRKDRFQSPSIATNGTDVYLAYYDLLNSQLHFKSGKIGDSKDNFGNFYDRDSNSSSSDYSQQVSWLNNDGSYGGLGAAGPYVSIGVTSTNQVAMVWYDSENDCLRYSLNTSPRNTNNNANFHRGKNTTGWTATTTLFTGGGQYCKLVVDNENGVHIAAYDSESNAIRYIYISDASSPDTRKEALVDLYSGVGENLTIDVAQDGSYQVPSIGYWSGYPALPKYATLANPAKFFAATDAVTAGCTEKGEFTGIWDCTYIPTTSSPQKNTVNVGLWKNSVTANTAGKLAYSTTGNRRGLETGTNSHASSYAAETTGICYGNGTKNAVLGYVVAPTSSEYNIETAQKK